jgi:hypothetical protein
MLGIGAHLSDEDARKIGGLWGPDPVHPSKEAYKVLDASIKDDLSCGEARYTNPPRRRRGTYRRSPRIDLAKTRQEWVEGCSATLPRRDTVSGVERGGLSGGHVRGRGRERGGIKRYYRSFHWKKHRDVRVAQEGENNPVRHQFLIDGFYYLRIVPYCTVKHKTNKQFE